MGIRSAIADLTQRAGGALDDVTILTAERVTWPDAALGCPEPDGFYAQVLTPGIRLVLSHQDSVFDYRITSTASRLCTLESSSRPINQQPLEGIWSRLAEAPTARSEVTAAELNGKIYVMGGFGAGATANEEYDPAANVWRARTPVPRGVDHAAAVSLNGVIYLIGGFDGRWGPVANVWSYNPDSDTWTAAADLNTPRGALVAAVVQGKIYAMGGVSAQGNVGDVEEYDPAADTWVHRSPMPTARDHIAAAVVDEKIYVFGGRLGSFARNLAANESYDPEADSWTERALLPTPRSGIAAASYRGQVYVFGGEAVGGTFDQNERYDPEADTWSIVTALPTARHGLGGVTLGNRIYVVAGGTTPGGSSSGLNEVFIVIGDISP